MGHYGRGAYRFASEKIYDMVAFSWCDGNPVNIITTADGSGIGHVHRQIGQKKNQAPMQYNNIIKIWMLLTDGIRKWGSFPFIVIINSRNIIGILCWL